MEYLFPSIAIVKYAGLGTIVLGILLLLGVMYGKKSPLSYIFGSIISIALGLFLMLYGAKGGSLKIEHQILRLKIPLYHERILVANQIEQVQVVELNAQSPLLPIRKKSGAATKYLKTGWFILRNGEKAFIAVEGKRALYIKSKQGNIYLVGIKEFDKFLNVFQNMILPVK